MAKIEDLLGKTLVSVLNNDNDEILFTDVEGSKWRMYHEQDCCEDVRVEDVIGSLDDLVGSPILLAEVVNNGNHPDTHIEDEYCSSTWTFYKLATLKGYVTIRWYGESNGYYSEEVDFAKIK